MSDAPRVIVSQDLTEFFHKEVLSAKLQLNVDLPQHAEFYLVNLCCTFSKPDKNNPVVGEEPLALIYKRAIDADPERRAVILKDLGDVALYIAGFFTDFIEHSLVDIDYYISMGGSAYGNLSDLVGGKKHGETFAELYGTLAQKFTEAVDILNEIAARGQQNPRGDAELLKIYDRWTRTGSERLRRQLRQQGLLPMSHLPTEYVQ